MNSNLVDNILWNIVNEHTERGESEDDIDPERVLAELDERLQKFCDWQDT